MAGSMETVSYTHLDVYKRQGVVFRKGSKVRVDAHYEAVEIKIRRSVLEQGIYLCCKTPFGTVGEMYYCLLYTSK